MSAVKGQPHRLAAEAGSLVGRAIDRSRPLAFRLNGREIRGFAGDTILSATLASGILQAGWRNDQPLALDSRLAPPVVPRSAAGDRRQALPMDRTPAVDGADLVTLGPRHRRQWGLAPTLEWLARPPPLTLRHEFGAGDDGNAPWQDAPSDEGIETDFVVVGGGVAGLRAAVAAASTGERVILVERRPVLGGDARYFGTTEEEQSPDATIGDLTARLGALAGVTVLLSADAFGIYDHEVRVHQVVASDGPPRGRVLTLAARCIILATGTIERLPVFPGNRLPRVTRSVAAFNLADRFGVWIGRKALFSTVSGFAYRLAVEAVKAGVNVERVADARLAPQSRFIDFAKAYGIRLGFGVRPAEAGLMKTGGIAVTLAAATHRGEPDEQPFAADQFVVCGGWQPSLRLWHLAGGASRWEAGHNRLAPTGTLSGIEIVGAAAGWRSTSACLESAAAAVAVLLERRPEPVEERLIDPAFETPDDPTPIAAPRETDAIAYLDGGQSLVERPAATTRRKGWFGLFQGRDPVARFLEDARALSIGDIAAVVQIGAIQPADAGTIAQERCVPTGALEQRGAPLPPAAPAAPPADAQPYPAYLAGRYGADARIWRIEAKDKRTFETGCLIYPDADKTDPLLAVGVVLAPATDGATALIGGERKAGDDLAVRDISGAIAVQLAEPPAAAPEAPAESTEPTKPAETAEAAEPTVSAEPSEPTEPAKPAGPTDS